jgi:hypothetical protein
VDLRRGEIAVFSCLLFAAATAPSPYVESKEFPRPFQEQALAATANVFVPTKARIEGTAVAVKHKDGMAYYLTAAHNVPEKEGDGVELEVFHPTTYPKVHARVTGRVEARNLAADLAVIAVPMTDRPGVLPICPKAKLIRPEEFPFPVLTVGCDDSMGKPQCQLDVVEDKKTPDKGNGSQTVHWQTRIAQAKGRSGGPLLDTRGYVIGICSGVQRGKGYYVYITNIHEALQRAGYGWLCE